ncbi:MAG: hypothetical protein E1N59_2256 [Puniceicoccaceae bacterium 5H]|nr:MAG: hypothetical protein E1N59_2256 [Puniceicoccaceae bacterium 5H]
MIVLAGAGFAVLAVLVINPLSAKAKEPTRAQRIEQGRHIVHQVAMCVDCHSPRGPGGVFIEDRHLTGAKLDFAATVPMPWASVAPPLAGLPPGWTEEEMIVFLETGQRPLSLPPTLPPMPQLRFSQEEAMATAAYLASLHPAE